MCVEVKDVHTKEDLVKFAEKESKKEWKIKEEPLWRWYCVTDYSKDCSWLIFTFNHCLIDGINIATFLKLASDNYDPNSIRVPKGMKDAPLPVKVTLGIVYGIINGLWLLTRAPAQNALKKIGIPAKEDMHLHLIDDIDNKVFTKVRRHYKASFVQCVHAIMGQTFHDYMRAHDCQDKEVLFSTTIAYKFPPYKISDMQPGNFWYPCVMPIKLTSDFLYSLLSAKSTSKKYAGTMGTLGYMALQSLHNLPFNLANVFYILPSRNCSFGFSSVPGPVDGWLFNGIKTKGFYAFYPSLCEQLCNSMTVSMDETIKICFRLDYNYIKKPDLFIKMFNDRMTEFISQKVPEIDEKSPTLS